MVTDFPEILMARAVKLLLLGALTLIPLGLAGQTGPTVVSLRAGLNVSTFGGGDVIVGLDHRVGANIGAGLTIPMTETLGIFLGASYSQKGAKPPVDLGADLALTVDYLEFPALLRLAMIPSEGSVGAHVLLGPVMALQVNCEGRGSVGSFDLSVSCDRLNLDTKTFDIGVAGGLGLDMQATERATVTLDVLYNLGLASIEDGVDVKNRAWTIQAGIGVPIGGS